jgi:hypothetical protein
MSWIHHIEAKRIDPRYETKQDGDGDMLYLLDIVGGKGLCLCGSNVEIFQLLEDAISHVPMGDQEPPMKFVQTLIQKAHDKGLLRYAPPNLAWDVQPANRERHFELRRTAMSGVEFGYVLSEDAITWAIQSIDGVELEPAEFLQELIDKTSDPKPESDEEQMRECDQCGRTEPASGFLDWVNGMCENCDPNLVNDPENQRRIKGDWDDQPCQHYAQARAIVDEVPEVTEHNDVETIVVDDHKLDNLFDQALFWAGEVRQTRMAEQIGGNTTWSRSYSRQQFIDAMRAFITEETGS